MLTLGPLGPSFRRPRNPNQFRGFPYSRDVVPLPFSPAPIFGFVRVPGPSSNSPFNLNQFRTFPYAFSNLAPPQAPAGLNASAGNQTVALSWNPVPGAVSYSVYMGLSSGTETLLASGVLVPSYVASGLTNGVTYYFKVSATNVVGEGALSTEASATPQALAGNVIISIKLELFEIERGSISLAWTSFPQNFPTAVYQVSVNDVIVATTTTVRIATVTGLAVDTSYVVKIIGGLPSQLPVQSNIIAYQYGSTEIAYKTVPIVGIPPGN